MSDHKISFAHFACNKLTTLCNPLRLSLARSAIIGLLFLLSSCSMLRMGYDQGPQLLWWWLDGYVNFSKEQTPQVKDAIRQWFDWHRATQLPEYAAWLAALHDQLDDPVTPAQVCRWSEELRDIVAPALDHALQLGAPLVPGLGETQWRHIEQHYTKGNEEFRSYYLQPDLEERLEASIKRTVKRVENLYGRIDEAQRRLITASLKTSPFDPQAWLVERQRRQHETLLTLRRLAGEPAETHITAALRMLVGHVEHSADTDYRDYQKKLIAYNCDFVARLHNSTTAIQRQHARDKIKSWETDLRILADDVR